MTYQNNLRRLLAPQHVAFVGGSTMAKAVQRCRAAGFAGEVWLVNPQHNEINGERCYASVADLPAAPDATYIGIGKEATVDVVGQLKRIGAGGVVCYASGFAETGAEGAALQAQLLEAAGDMALIGPNCYGMLNYLHGAALWPVAHGGQRVERGVAVLTQSGNFAYNLSMGDGTVPYAYIISVGNQAATDIAQLIEVLVEDPRITAIGLHLEGLKNVEAFVAASNRALEVGVPIITLKSGRSQLGAKIALSHTSSLAGSDKLYDALFKRTGVVRVSSPTSFLETLKVAAQQQQPTGNRLAALASSGGDAGFIADQCEPARLDLPQPSEIQAQSLRAILPAYATVSNPLDYTTTLWGNRELLHRCITTLLSEGADYGVLMLDYPTEESGERPDCDLILDVFKDVLRELQLPGAVISAFSDLLPSYVRHRMHGAGVPALQGVEEGIAAIGRMIDYQANRQALLETPGTERIAYCMVPELEADSRLLDEGESKAQLAAFGLPVPESRIVAPDQAVNAAGELGYPLVIKALSAELPHKTEAGAVALKLQNADQVAQAAEGIIENVRRYNPAVTVDRLLIEKMADEPLAELIIGVNRTSSFGLALVIGAGGILVELMNDSTCLMLPVSPKEVRRAVEQLQINKLLSGYRGKPACNMDALVEAIMAVANYAVANSDRLVELDVNPLLVLKDGVVAVDALIRESI